MLTNAIREALLGHPLNKKNGYAYASFSLVMDALLFVGVKPDELLTRAQINTLVAEFGTSEKVVRAACSCYLFRQSELITGGKGRPEFVYRVPDVEKLEMELAPGASRCSDSLYACDFGSLKDYKMAIHAEFVARMYRQKHSAVSFSRQFAANRIGSSPATVRRYDRELRTTCIERFSRALVTFKNFHLLPERVGADRSTFLQITWPDGRIQNAPLVRFVAYRALRAGATVEKVQRLTNAYIPGNTRDGIRYTQGKYRHIILS